MIARKQSFLLWRIIKCQVEFGKASEKAKMSVEQAQWRVSFPFLSLIVFLSLRSGGGGVGVGCFALH